MLNSTLVSKAWESLVLSAWSYAAAGRAWNIHYSILLVLTLKKLKNLETSKILIKTQKNKKTQRVPIWEVFQKASWMKVVAINLFMILSCSLSSDQTGRSASTHRRYKVSHRSKSHRRKQHDFTPYGKLIAEKNLFNHQRGNELRGTVFLALNQHLTIKKLAKWINDWDGPGVS